MSEEGTFLAAIRATPMDDTLRLVYADWLDEQGRPEGSFLRLECKLAALGPNGFGPIEPHRWELKVALREARASLDPQWLATVSRILPDVPFDEDAGSSYLWHSIFEDWLQLAAEPALWGESGERYWFVRSAGGPEFLLRIETDPGEVIVKRVVSTPDGCEVGEFRRPLSARDLARLRRQIERVVFWEIPSPNDRRGFDGAHYLFEARTRDRYHFVQRWSPSCDGFARLCQHCELLYQSIFEPRRAWWHFW